MVFLELFLKELKVLAALEKMKTDVMSVVRVICLVSIEENCIFTYLAKVLCLDD